MKRLMLATAMLIVGSLTMIGSALAETTKICVPEKPSKPVLSASAKNECPTKSATKYETETLPSSAELEVLDKILPHVKYEQKGVAGKPTVQFSGVNVQVVDGEGKTASINGEGNLIIGYDENPNGHTQTGSHDLILGEEQTFTSFAGLVAGKSNVIDGEYASVTGGVGNSASGIYSAVTGGATNTASGVASSVTAGEENAASGKKASVDGGKKNAARELYASVSGGFENLASGFSASVTAGFKNTASGEGASVSAGDEDIASGKYASVSGGGGSEDTSNRATGELASISGGVAGTASGIDSSVSGGLFNTASGESASIDGGQLNLAEGPLSWIGGGASNTVQVAGTVGSTFGGFGVTVGREIEGCGGSPGLVC
jgi:trimeric autotransporter adhesin